MEPVTYISGAKRLTTKPKRTNRNASDGLAAIMGKSYRAYRMFSVKDWSTDVFRSNNVFAVDGKLRMVVDDDLTTMKHKNKPVLTTQVLVMILMTMMSVQGRQREE